MAERAGVLRGGVLGWVASWQSPEAVEELGHAHFCHVCLGLATAPAEALRWACAWHLLEEQDRLVWVSWGGAE